MNMLVQIKNLNFFLYFRERKMENLNKEINMAWKIIHALRVMKDGSTGISMQKYFYKEWDEFRNHSGRSGTSELFLYFCEIVKKEYSNIIIYFSGSERKLLEKFNELVLNEIEREIKNRSLVSNVGIAGPRQIPDDIIDKITLLENEIMNEFIDSKSNHQTYFKIFIRWLKKHIFSRIKCFFEQQKCC
jgi:hypothetical protein